MTASTLTIEVFVTIVNTFQLLSICLKLSILDGDVLRYVVKGSNQDFSLDSRSSYFTDTNGHIFSE